MSDIKVDFGSLTEGESAIKGVYQQLVSTLEQLEADLRPMVSSWSGAAQESYTECQQRWDRAAADLSVLLNQIGQAVGTANDNYQAAESAARSNWS
ncbi:MAG: WXG100 family type VII secretion target [Frankiaceae bacterium]|jgi:WXG100 family type VII secretion target|nr:WXG100 family type VII secretion target [Frankiaceae bacterium]